MNTSRLFLALGISILSPALLPRPVLAQDAAPTPPPNMYSVATTTVNNASSAGIGASNEAASLQASRLITSGHLDEGEKLVNETLAKFDALMTGPGPYVCIANDGDYQKYVQTLSPAEAKSLVRVHISFATCLQARAFVYSDRKQWEEALAALDKTIKYCPYELMPRTEKAYILHATGKLKEAVDAYDAAEKLCIEHHLSAKEHAVAVRGKASTLIDLGKLDEAEAVYKKSLEIEPGNKLALDELDYIKQVRANQKKTGQ